MPGGMRWLIVISEMEKKYINKIKSKYGSQYTKNRPARIIAQYSKLRGGDKPRRYFLKRGLFVVAGFIPISAKLMLCEKI
jgi:hypothetical protein